MTQTTAIPDHLIDPRLHRLDNLGRAAKRSRPYGNETSVANRGPWRGPSTRTRPNAPIGLDSNDLSQAGFVTRPEHITVSGLSPAVKETCETDWLCERDSDRDYDSCSDYDSGSESQLLLEEDGACLANDNEFSRLNQAANHKSIPATLKESVGMLCGNPGYLVFTAEMSRIAEAAFFSQSKEAAPPCKLLELLLTKLYNI